MKRITILLILGILAAGCARQSPGNPPSTDLSSQPPPTPDQNLIPTTIPWWKEAVFYEIFVRSFYDSDGDGIGDFNGLTQKLDYLNDGDPDTDTDLGITAIWLMPIHPSPSYHGYDVLNYYGINHDYGTMQDFKNFLAEAHKRGIKVIIDLVLNHTSDQHPFFRDALRADDSDYHDWYIWTDVSQGASWHQTKVGNEEQYYYGYFCGCMPDLNYENAEVTRQMEKVAKYWLEDVGVDGFRVDAVKHLIEEEDVTVNSPATHQWFKDFYLLYKDVNSEAYSVGEVANSDAQISSTYTGDQFDQIFNFALASAVVNSVYGEATSSINSAVMFTLDDMPDWNFATLLSNHDQNRVMSVLGGNIEKAKIAAFILLTSPGTPYIYYGEEIGMTGRKPDEFLRRPMQWTNGDFGGFSTAQPWQELDSSFVGVNVQAQIDEPNSLLSNYRSLISIRNNHPALSIGSYISVDSTSNGVYAFVRQYSNETILMVVNLTKNNIIDYDISASNINLPDDEYTVSDMLSGNTGSRLTIQKGGFEKYRPFDQLNPYTGYIFEITK